MLQDHKTEKQLLKEMASGDMSSMEALTTRLEYNLWLQETGMKTLNEQFAQFCNTLAELTENIRNR